MKSKLFITAIFLLSSIQITFSQAYHPMLNNSTWLLYDWTSHGRPSEERMIDQAEDIIIGTHTYKKYIDQFPSYDNYSNLLHTVYLREDVVERKVYKIVDGVELLLYDFNLENGSTIYQYGNTFTAIIDYVAVNNGNRKRITLKSTEEYCGEKLTQVWIEGVGSDKHPFYPDYSMYNVCSASGGIMVFTKCSFQNGEHIFGSQDCSSTIALSIGQSDVISEAVIAYPNPYAEKFKLNVNTSSEDQVGVRVYDMLGREVETRQASVAAITNLEIGSQYPSGVYNIVVTQGNNVKTVRVVKR